MTVDLTSTRGSIWHSTWTTKPLSGSYGRSCRSSEDLRPSATDSPNCSLKSLAASPMAAGSANHGAPSPLLTPLTEYVSRYRCAYIMLGVSVLSHLCLAFLRRSFCPSDKFVAGGVRCTSSYLVLETCIGRISSFMMASETAASSPPSLPNLKRTVVSNSEPEGRPA